MWFINEMQIMVHLAYWLGGLTLVLLVYGFFSKKLSYFMENYSFKSLEKRTEAQTIVNLFRSVARGIIVIGFSAWMAFGVIIPNVPRHHPDAGNVGMTQPTGEVAPGQYPVITVPPGMPVGSQNEMRAREQKYRDEIRERQERYAPKETK